jgi:signal transduction histidine kinase
MKQQGAKAGHGVSLRFRTINTLLGLLGLVALSPAVRGEEPQVMTPGGIHSMHREEAALGRPVKVRGVVTFAYPEKVGEFVIEDASGGLYISAGDPAWNRKLPPVASLVEVTGVTGEGGYAPVVKARSVEILGEAELPLAQPVTANQLLTGRFDSRRVEIRGVVWHAIHRDRIESFALELAGEFGRVTVFALEAGGIVTADLIDAEVTVRGVCFPFFNERAQVAGARLEMTSAREIEITRPPFKEPFATPLVSMGRLQPFSPEGSNFHRQRLRGTVTLVNPGNYLYLQDGNHAVRVNLAERSTVQVGDRIEAVGFPDLRTRFVEWQQAIIKKTGTAPVPAPVAITPDLVLLPASRIEDRARNDWDGRLVTLTGRLDKLEALKEGQRQLFMDCDGHVITMLLEWPDAGAQIDALRPGTMISTTGICVVDYSKTWPTLDYAEPSEMQLLLRGPYDIAVLQAAPWWTPVHLRLALGAILVILFASLAWVGSLRRQVIKRTAALAHETRARRDAEVEFDATLSERERMAVDLHDTVEQALTGVSYQLEVSEALHQSEPQRSLQHLDLAKQLLAQSREEVRRSVWNLRAQSLNGSHLAEVLRDVAAGLSTRNPVQTRVTVNGEECELPDFIAGHLLLLAQESMTNAIKHAHPETIHIALEFDENSVELCVHDDGAGFDPGHAPGLAEGHLGLQGMRERMKRLGGEVKVESSPGHGTTIRARVPLPE